MSDIAIRVEGLSKRYSIGGKQERYKTLRDACADILVSPFRRLRTQRAAAHEWNGDAHIWALRDVSLEVRHGEVVGVIGPNGAGKSTLLKIFSRITEPTKGYAEIQGRVGSLLEVGTGFHGELTGRENIYLNGAILGMRRAEIERKFDEIVAFAEVEKFVDMPVKHYSSGMYLRLAFAVAAHLEPEILLVDEVLAVGDAAFRKKCLGKMGHISEEGRTVLFVSHDMGSITHLCSRSILLQQGSIVADGATQDVVAAYMSRIADTSGTELADLRDRSGSGVLRMTKLSFLTDGAAVNGAVQSGQNLSIAIDYESDQDAPLTGVVVRVVFSTLYGERLFTCLSRSSSTGYFKLPPRGRMICTIPKLPLVPGEYVVGGWFKVNEEVADCVENMRRLTVVEGDFFNTGRKVPTSTNGAFLVEHSWRVEESASANCLLTAIRAE
jgi:lipopolysaccharide transport system ATP-binding protein